jgi:hypothetical protein
LKNLKYESNKLYTNVNWSLSAMLIEAPEMALRAHFGEADEGDGLWAPVHRAPYLATTRTISRHLLE